MFFGSLRMKCEVNLLGKRNNPVKRGDFRTKPGKVQHYLNIIKSKETYSINQVNRRSFSTFITNDPRTNLVWLDLEMTGLEVEKDEILEISIIVTNLKLEILNRLPTPTSSLVINHSDTVLQNMNNW